MGGKRQVALKMALQDARTERAAHWLAAGPRLRSSMVGRQRSYSI